MKKLSLLVLGAAIIVLGNGYIDSASDDRLHSTVDQIQNQARSQHVAGGNEVWVVAGNTACNPRVTVCEE